MTDLVFDFNGNDVGKNPITKMGNVVYNAYRNDPDIAQSKANVQSGTSKYGGATDDSNFSILPGYITWAYRNPSIGKRKAKGHDLYVRTTLNGAFLRSQELYEIQNNILILGISKTRALYDRNGNHSEIDTVVQMGGLATIVNTGKKPICNGDWVRAELPDPNNPIVLGRRNASNIYMWTTPFDPRCDMITASNLGSILGKGSSPKKLESERDKPMIEAATKVRNAILQAVLNSFHIALASGLFSVNIDLDTDDGSRKTASRGYLDSSNSGQREKILTRLASMLGIHTESTTKMEVTARGSQQSLGDFALDVFLADDAHLLLPRTETGGMPSGNKGKVLQGQLGFLRDIFGAATKANHMVTDTIIGKAITPAATGEDFDVLLGRYTM